MSFILTYTYLWLRRYCCLPACLTARRLYTQCLAYFSKPACNLINQLVLDVVTYMTANFSTMEKTT